MSGGFFRGTSADQDTRFSNKQAKLLKSQKFAPELENLVDMTKVKMDVMRPWIAKRVTELIGFEDEVLINFIYSLLEGTAVNGKQVQISLTGFMERNTGKFMKELWALLLSAQQNVSGVPQQFLDAKEEETKKKKAETDHIANEIQKKKEKEKLEFQQEKKMDGNDSMSRDKNAELELNVKHDVRGSAVQPANEKEQYKRNAGRGNRGSQSPNSAYRSPSPRPKHSITPSRSSNSRSHSDKRRRSSSTSGASPSRSQSIPSERRHVDKEQSVTPHRRHIIRRFPSPWHRSLHSKQRSTSRSRHRSPSPARRRVRSPWRHRSRSPVRRRSRSPVRRRSRSPIRRRSRSPIRRRSRSPLRRRSRSPVRRRSRSPVGSRSRTPIRRSPVQYRSRTPIRRRSPSPVQGSSPAFTRGRSLSFVSHKSPSPVHGSSPSPMHHQSASPVQRGSPFRRRQPSLGRRRYQRSPSTPRKRSVSPLRIRPSVHGEKRSTTVNQRSIPEESSSPPPIRRSSLSPARRGSVKITRSPIQSLGERARRHENYSPVRRASNGRPEPLAESRKGIRSVEGKPVVSLRSPQRDTLDKDDLRGKEQDLSSSLQKSPSVSHVLRNRSYSDEQRSETTGLSVKGRDSYDDDGARAKEKKKGRADDNHQFPQQEALPKLSREPEQNDRNGSLDSPCKETHEHRFKVKGKRKHRKSVRQEVESDNYSSYDSYEERKEAKRRRKEEKKLKKEERRRRREERRRRRDERRLTEKLKLKSGSDSSSSELGRDHSEDDSVRRRGSQVSNAQETESEQKKLEIELREKALESLRAKKGFGN